MGFVRLFEMGQLEDLDESRTGQSPLGQLSHATGLAGNGCPDEGVEKFLS